jgi:hypothetical protein
MPDNEIIIKLFVTNFILKDKRERSNFELTNPKKRNKFTDRLNHQWDTILDIRRLIAIGKKEDRADFIQKLLGFKDDEICYVISNYSTFDDKFMPFNEIFPQIYGAGLGSIILNTTGDKLFLETEHVIGPASRFVGRVQK